MNGKQRAPKPDRRTIAYLDAAVLAVAGAKGKLPVHDLIEQLSRDGIHVTFDQVEKSVRRLGLKWRDAFLPATRVERGYPDARANDAKPKADKWSVFEELDKTTDVHWSTADPDMQAVFDRIEQLEQTVTRRGLAEYSGLHQQAQAEAGLAKERAAAIRVDMRTLLNRVEEVYSQQQALLRLVSSIRLHQDRQQSQQATPTQEPQP